MRRTAPSATTASAHSVQTKGWRESSRQPPSFSHQGPVPRAARRRAQLTDFGERLVALYRSMERRSRSASAQALAELTASLDPSFVARASGEAAVDQPRPRLSRSRRT